VSPTEKPQVRRARYEDWPSVALLLREIDDLHASLAPQYFRSATRVESEWLTSTTVTTVMPRAAS